MKEWYDGYHFGDADIYYPWDVINYVDDLVSDPNVQPKSYWINSSGNDLVKRFIEQADITTKDEIEQLIAGNAVEKRIRSDLTYDEIGQQHRQYMECAFYNRISHTALKAEKWRVQADHSESGSPRSFCSEDPRMV